MRTENKDKELNHRHFIGLRLTDGIESIHSMITGTLFHFNSTNWNLSTYYHILMLASKLLNGVHPNQKLTIHNQKLTKH